MYNGRMVEVDPILRLLGHRSIKSTMLYLHLAHTQLVDNPSPLDLLELPNRTPAR